ncbi:ABC transporter substrate-binding protein [Tsukamurella sp. 8F]|uniref:ABC transporter substrate-binding protein n=1 Tax=unclassified Tsukamurella TaxID=2633480 RepID=UPI0023B99625|nr:MULTISPECIES: ABC transporter substrate-binding protein [unclassified Tsukamurella]MDF0531165.1 ABC transporter substrate-binding protein [Tsukamurella sp. 8J]MDF0585888.1 ABC transporter substrate-binding protein [Tsukamurella sp. 8F]
MTAIPVRSRAAALAAVLLSAVLVLTACGGSDDSSGSTGQTRQFQADNGTVEIPVHPQRIVAISNGVVPAIVLGTKPVGVSDLSNFSAASRWFSPDQLAAYQQAAKVGTVTEVDVEEVARLKPDLIYIASPKPTLDKTFAPIEDRLRSIAPTIFITNNNAVWKKEGERTADALGRSELFDSKKAEYDKLVASMKSEFTPFIKSKRFVQFDRFPQTAAGTVAIDYSGGFCAVYATEVGLDFPKSAAGRSWDEMSMERLSDYAGYDALIYPLGPNGEPKDEFVPVLDSNIWKALPQVGSGRAVGVTCPGTGFNYPNGITSLNSLRKALGTLAKK